MVDGNNCFSRWQRYDFSNDLSHSCLAFFQYFLWKGACDRKMSSERGKTPSEGYLSFMFGRKYNPGLVASITLNIPFAIYGISVIGPLLSFKANVLSIIVILLSIIDAAAIVGVILILGITPIAIGIIIIL